METIKQLNDLNQTMDAVSMLIDKYSNPRNNQTLYF